jgi:glutamate-ammonia-ligase adenylyltransferase
MAEPEQEQLVRQVADLFGASEPLSRGLIGFGRATSSTHDGGLALLLEASASELPYAAELRERFATARQKHEGTQSLDDQLLRFKHRELVRIGLYDLGRRPDPLAIGRSLSDLADLIVRELLADLASLHDGSPSGFTLAVLAIGKFGMQAMDYGSDLDLMFVYEPDPGVASTAVRDAAQQVSRKLLARLQDRGGGLRLYEVDMRLRPSGRQGLLVSSLEGFRSYHERPLEVWERLALVRLRDVAAQHFGPDAITPGDHLSQTLLEEVVPSSVWAPVDPAHVATETRRLKQRIESELARETRDNWNVKTGVGGVLELELLTSALQLSHDVRAREIPTALHELAERGVVDPSEAAALDGAYRFERRLLNRLRMSRSAGWGEDDRLPLNSPRLTALARRMGVADRDALISTLERQRAIIRTAFDRYLPSHDAHD